MIQILGSGSVASTTFSKVIGVGHPLESELTNAITSQYPKDIDAVVLTGFSVDIAGQSNVFSALNLAIARENQPSRFPLLSNGYLISNTIMGNQFTFSAPRILILLFLPLQRRRNRLSRLGNYLLIASLLLLHRDLRGGWMWLRGSLTCRFVRVIVLF
jgi:hypothetical protein